MSVSSFYAEICLKVLLLGGHFPVSSSLARPFGIIAIGLVSSPGGDRPQNYFATLLLLYISVFQCVF